ncbi:MAG: YbaB/EbfC family nucleoid-associated protein [Mycoplasmataceae bacterium]|jgi:DNA-binding YbaB/EbfC family protein|nr:YbaB/EbfC family nucleoid-associated protein [Mycoplasmataceae bacterium]
MNMQSMMAEAQRMQKELQRKMDEFKAKAFEYSYKNGAVVVIIGGDFTIQSINIDKVLIDPDDKKTLEEMVSEAVNAAIKGVEEDQKAIQNSIK